MAIGIRPGDWEPSNIISCPTQSGLVRKMVISGIVAPRQRKVGGTG